jgi:hypothetical protein
MNGENGTSGKRKVAFETPSTSKVSKAETNRQLGDLKTPQKPSNDVVTGIQYESLGRGSGESTTDI